MQSIQFECQVYYSKYSIIFVESSNQDKITSIFDSLLLRLLLSKIWDDFYEI